MKSEERACHVLPSSFFLPPVSCLSSSSACVSLFAVILFLLLLLSHLFIRDPTLPLFIHLLSTVIPFAHSFFPAFIFLRRTFWRGATKDQPTDQFHRESHYGKYFAGRTDFQLLRCAVELDLQNAKAEVTSAESVDLHVQTNVTLRSYVSCQHMCAPGVHKFQNNHVSVSLC